MYDSTVIYFLIANSTTRLKLDDRVIYFLIANSIIRLKLNDKLFICLDFLIQIQVQFEEIVLFLYNL